MTTDHRKPSERLKPLYEEYRRVSPLHDVDQEEAGEKHHAEFRAILDELDAAVQKLTAPASSEPRCDCERCMKKRFDRLPPTPPREWPKLSLREAKNQLKCRLCGEPMDGRDGETYNYGHEYSHTGCYQKHASPEPKPSATLETAENIAGRMAKTLDDWMTKTGDRDSFNIQAWIRDALTTFAALRNRPDIPIERVKGYDDLLARATSAETSLAATKLKLEAQARVIEAWKRIGKDIFSSGAYDALAKAESALAALDSKPAGERK